MDPITLGRLLSIADAVEEHRDRNRLTSSMFRQIIAQQTQAKDLARRERDILRILSAMGWMVSGGTGTLCLNQRFTEFISAWNGKNLLHINQCLSDYPPYASFLVCLRQEKVIPIPNRDDKEAKRRLGRRLKDNYGITFVAFSTFRSWAIAVGQAYLSPPEQSLYWGGDWDDLLPSIQAFETACRESYRTAEKTSGYANIGRLADVVCRRLHISFQAFEMKMKLLVDAKPGTVTLARATIRDPSWGFQITTVRPRSEILGERLTARLRDIEKPPRPQWLEHRYLEDGIRINGLVEVIEPDFAHQSQLAYVRIGPHLCAATGVLDARSVINVGDPVDVVIPIDRNYFFDGESDLLIPETS